MDLRRYWTLSKKHGQPAEVRKATWVNGAKLPPDFVHGFDSQLALMDSSWLLGLLAGPDRHGPPEDWEVVEVNGDAEEAVVARKPIKIEGVFVKAYGEVQRIPLKQWIEDGRSSEDPAVRKCAENQVLTMEIAAEGYD